MRTTPSSGRTPTGASRPTSRPSSLGLVLLETRDHYDSFADMPDDLLAELGPLTARIERAILGLGGIARVHVLRYGDGGEHFHLWFMPRPLGALQMRGSMLPVWMDVLPKLPEAQATRRWTASPPRSTTA